jgi:hypothetical protein
VGLERGPLSLVSTTDEILERKSSGSSLDNREYGCRNPSRWPRGILYPKKLARISPTSGGHSVGIVRSRTKDMEFSFSACVCVWGGACTCKIHPNTPTSSTFASRSEGSFYKCWLYKEDLRNIWDSRTFSLHDWRVQRLGHSNNSECSSTAVCTSMCCSADSHWHLAIQYKQNCLPQHSMQGSALLQAATLRNAQNWTMMDT